jgi:hypothetical protein
MAFEPTDLQRKVLEVLRALQDRGDRRRLGIPLAVIYTELSDHWSHPAEKAAAFSALLEFEQQGLVKKSQAEPSVHRDGRVLSLGSGSDIHGRPLPEVVVEDSYYGLTREALAILDENRSERDAVNEDDSFYSCGWFEKYGIADDKLRDAKRKKRITARKGNGNRNLYRVADVKKLWPDKFARPVNGI